MQIPQVDRGFSDRSGPATGCFIRDLEVAVLTLVAASVMVAFPITAHIVNPLLGILTVLLLATICAIVAPGVAIVTILASFMFQNLVVSLVSNWVHSKVEFDVIRAYNFLILCTCWLTIAIRFLMNWRTKPGNIVIFLKVTTAALTAIGVYFVVGFALYGTAAIVNLRNIAMPLLLFQICLVVFAERPVRITPALTGLGISVIFCAITEVLFRDQWLTYTNSEKYWSLFNGPNWATLQLDEHARKTGEVITTLTDTFRISFFNSPLLSDIGVPVMRIFGPNMHAISFAYCLIMFAIFTLYRGRLLQATVFIALAMLCSVKGPVIVFLMVAISWSIYCIIGSRLAFAFHSIVVVAYAVVGVIVGSRIGDYHVLGLISGFYNFLENPIGRGIGIGGNLSPLFNTIDFQQAQAVGHTPFPVESSVGVLLYQMGIFALAPIGAYVWLSWKLLKLGSITQNGLHVAMAFTLLSIVANGLFQEEAYFAPLSLTSFLALGGMIIGAGVREGMTG